MTEQIPEISDNKPQYYLDQDDEINLVDLIYPIFKHRKFLIFFTILITVVMGIVSLNLKKTYESEVTLLPEAAKKESGLVLNLQSALSEQLGFTGIGESGTRPDIQKLVKSKQIERAVKSRYLYPAIAPDMNFKVEVPDKKDEPESIVVQASDPVLAADIANTYAIELDRFNRDNSITNTKRLREYIEQRLHEINIELDEAQQELRNFQEKNRAVSIEKQTEATLEVLADLESQRVVFEIEKAAKEKFYKDAHLEINKIQAQMDAIQKNIDRLTYSQEDEIPVEKTDGKIDFYIPLKRIPGLTFDESKLLLNVKTKTSIVTMLIAELEQAKLDETKDMPTINVLDWAEPPQIPIKPNVKLNIIFSAVVSLFLGIFLIFLMEFAKRIDQDPEASPRWREMKQGFRKLIPFVRKAD